jgi:uracil-DNA glycosylase family 4
LKTVGATQECNGCPLQKLQPEATFVAPLIRSIGTKLVVAEAAGQTESEIGEPLVGASGNWLRGRFDEVRKEWKGGLFGRAGIDDKEVSRINCINCKPPGNIFPTDPDAKSYISREDGQRAVEHCYDRHVRPVLASRNWSRIFVLGDKALRQVCKKDGGIMRWRGSPLPVPDIDPVKPLAVPTIHPAALARDQSMLPAVVSDLKKGLQLAPEHYNNHPGLDEVKAFKAKTFAFDIETSMLTYEVICVGLCAEAYTSMVVPCKGAYIPELRRIFENAEVIVGHNLIAFDIPRLFEVLDLKWEPPQ